MKHHVTLQFGRVDTQALFDDLFVFVQIIDLPQMDDTIS